MLRLFTLLATGLLLLAGASTTWAVDPQTDAANRAVDYILSQQNSDGGFIGFGADSAPGVTLDAVFALIAGGVDPVGVTTDGASPADYLSSQADTYSVDAGGAAKLMLGVIRMGLDYTDFGGTNGGLDLPSVLEGHLSEDPADGIYGFDLFDQAFSVLALTAAGEALRDSSVDYLRSLQLDDGGWEFDEGFASDSNSTAMAVQALLAAGVASDDPTIEDALGYFASIQDASGAFAFFADTDSDAQSTAMVIQALVAAGEDLDGWAIDDATPMDALLTFQNPETGAFQFAGEDSPFATYQVVAGLLMAPFPDLQTLPDGEPAPDCCVDPTQPSSTPAATAVQPDALPDTGGGSAGGTTPWWILAALMGSAAAAGAGAFAVRRR